MQWAKTVTEIPAWELVADQSFRVVKWGLGSWAAYHGDVRIGEPGSYGTRDEAQEAAEAEYQEAAHPFAEGQRLRHRRTGLLATVVTAWEIAPQTGQGPGVDVLYDGEARLDSVLCAEFAPAS